VPAYRSVDEETMKQVKNSAMLERDSIDACFVDCIDVQWREKLLDFAGQFNDYVLFKD
jgi:hypothetical protein